MLFVEAALVGSAEVRTCRIGYKLPRLTTWPIEAAAIKKITVVVVRGFLRKIARVSFSMDISSSSFLRKRLVQPFCFFASLLLPAFIPRDVSPHAFFEFNLWFPVQLTASPLTRNFLAGKVS